MTSAYNFLASKKGDSHYPFISEFLEIYDWSFEDRGQLRKENPGDGLTTLIPSDDATMKVIRDAKEAADPLAARAVFNKLSVRGFIADGPSWSSKTVLNTCRPPEAFDHIKASKKGVAIGSAQISAAEILRDSRIAIWFLTGGFPDTRPATPEEIPTMPEKVARREKRKTGKYEPSAEHAASLRLRICISVENRFNIDHLSGISAIDSINFQRGNARVGGVETTATATASTSTGDFGEAAGKFSTVAMSQTKRDALMENAISLAYFLYSDARDVFYECVLPVLALDPSDFYILVEPHKDPSRPYLIPTELIQRWFDSRSSFSISAARKTFSEALTNVPQNYRAAKIYSDRMGVFRAVDNARRRAKQNSGTLPVFAKTIADIYAAVESTNAIDGFGPIFPPGFAGFCAKNPGSLLMFDTLRFATFNKFQLFDMVSYDREEFHQFISMIGETMHNGTSILIRPEILANETIVTEYHSAIMIFLHSTCFLHIPATVEELRQLSPDIIFVVNPLKIPKFWNVQLATIERAKYLLAGIEQSDAARLAGYLAMLPDANKTGIPENILNLMKQYTGN